MIAMDNLSTHSKNIHPNNERHVPERARIKTWSSDARQVSTDTNPAPAVSAVMKSGFPRSGNVIAWFLCSSIEKLCVTKGFVGRFLFFFSSRRRHTRFSRDWSSDVCSSDLGSLVAGQHPGEAS